MVSVGLDIGKRSFVVTLLPEKGKAEHAEFSNDCAGFRQLSKWLRKRGVKRSHVCMEATSIYWEEVAEHLFHAGHRVSVVNPARIKGYAQGQLRRHKTDKVDSWVIADFCRTQKPDSWQPPSPAQRKLRALVRHRERLKEDRTRQKNRLESSRDPVVRASLERMIAQLDQELAAIEQEMEENIDQDPDLKEESALLRSIPGFGQATVTILLAEMPDLAGYKSAKAAAADAGVIPSHFESGESVRRRAKLSKIGKASVRSSLFFPALTAMQHNPVIRAFVARLEARHKPRKVIVAAVMRKLLHIAYGVLKNRTLFDPNHHLAAA